MVVELQPPTVLADGHAQSIARMAVLDENGTPIPGELELSSTDPGQHQPKAVIPLPIRLAEGEV